VLSARTILSSEGIEVADVACGHPQGRGQELEQASVHALVFVRRGCFVRSVAGTELVLDPTLAYCISPGEEQRYDHPDCHGDDCTFVSLAESLLATMWGGAPALPDRALTVSPALDLEHRMLLAAVRRDASSHELVERVISLSASALQQADARRVASARPSTSRARRALVDAVREALAVDPERSLIELARTLAVSPHHLSRVFRAATGHTVSRHRMRLRVRAALERLGDGESDLAWLASDLGFCDQSHLCRVIRSETGATPSALGHALAP
jgi:AraC-like DNA-binding protein